jgi:biopolymer transport protein ExbD
MKLPTAETEIDGLNLTPIIDVVFLLLIFFLVATRLDKEEREREIPIKIPTVVKAEPLSATKDLVIDVTREGTYRIRNREWNREEVRALLAEEAKVNPHRKIRIYGDEESALKHTAHVLGMCRSAGLENYQLAAVEESEK